MIGAHIQSQALAIADMHRSMGHGKVGRVAVEINAEDSAVGGYNRVRSKSDTVLAGTAVHLVISEARIGVNGRDGRAVRIAVELRQRQRTVGSYAGDGAIFKLDFQAAVVAGDEAHAFHGRHVGQRLVEGRFGSVEDLYLALNVAQAHRADIACLGRFLLGGL